MKENTEYPINILELGHLRIRRVDSHNYQVDEFKPVQNRKTKEIVEEWCFFGYYSWIESALKGMRNLYIDRKIVDQTPDGLLGLIEEFDKVIRLEVVA